jgi:heme/copper-type cytochrome/quinol oxidase subunit 2
MLFFQSNKMDVWMRITARAKQMEADAARAEGKRKAEAKRRQSEIDDIILITIAVLTSVFVLGLTVYFIVEMGRRHI